MMNSVIFSKYKIFLILVAFFLIWQTFKFLSWLQLQRTADVNYGPGSSGVIAPVMVSVFYEALCPDSKNFFIKQLKPAVEKASRLLNLTLIPYGKAKTDENRNGSIAFTCQHGPTECFANKVHACAISKISYSVLQVEYISCMIQDNMIPEMIGERCAKEYGVDWKSILKCTNSEKADFLLKHFGELTDSLDPKMTFVPTVLLNNRHLNQAAILKDFFKQVCLLFKELPEECISLF